MEVKDDLNQTIGKYWYDGDGKRIKKYVPATEEITIFVYDAAGKLVADYSTELSQDAKVSYTTADHLGSPRILTDENGELISRRDFHPFGEEIATTERTIALGYQTDDIRQKFTTYERDAETDLDYAQARMYGKNLGRFNTPDPLLSSGTVETPQSWNRYSYVENNPLLFVDPTGLFIWTRDLGGDAEDGELEDYFTREANLIQNPKKRNKALKRIKKQVKRTIEARNKIREGLKLEESLQDSKSLSQDQKSEIADSLNALGKEGDDNGVILGQKTGKGALAMFGEDDRIIVLLGKESSLANLAVSIVHEGSHVADFQAFNKGGEGSNITQYETEKKAWTVSAYVAKGLNLKSFPNTLPRSLRVWSRGWSEAEISTRVSNRLAGPNYFLTDTKQGRGKTMSEIKASDVESLRVLGSRFNFY